jgi:ATP-dependent helicase HrpA
LPDEIQTQSLYFGGKEAVEKAMMETLHREAFERDIRSEKELRAVAKDLTRDLFEISHTLGEVIQEILSAYHRVRMTMSGILKKIGDNRAVKSLVEDVKQELDSLVPRDFLTRYSLERLRHIPRYLEALRLRVERGSHDPAKDRAKAEQTSRFVLALENLGEEITADASFELKSEIEAYRWMVEEYKVSLFAPELKTAHPISAKRLLIKLKAIQAMS